MYASRNLFLRELIIYFEVSKNGVPESHFAEDDDEDLDKRSFEELPEWKLTVCNSFFRVDFGGEFVANVDPLDLVPQNEKSFLSLFSCMDKQKVGLFNESCHFQQTLTSLTRLCGYFLRFTLISPKNAHIAMVTSLVRSSFLGGFWLGLDLSLINDFRFLAEVNIQLLVMTYLQYYQDQLKQAASDSDQFAHLPAFSINKNSQLFNKGISKKSIEEFLAQFNLIPLSPTFQAVEHKTKCKFFLNCSNENLRFFRLNLKTTWRHVTCFKPPSVAFAQNLLVLHGVSDVSQVCDLLRRLWNKCRRLSLPFMLDPESPRVVWRLARLVKNELPLSRSFPARHLFSVFQRFFSSFIPKKFHHQLTSLLETLFLNYLPRKKYSLRPRKNQALNPFGNKVSSFIESFSLLLEFSSSVLVTGPCPPFLTTLLVKILNDNNCLAFNFSPLHADREDLLGANFPGEQTHSRPGVLHSTDSKEASFDNSSIFSKLHLSKSSQSVKRNSFHFRNINFKSKLCMHLPSMGFYSHLFRSLEDSHVNSQPLLSTLKRFGVFSFKESLNCCQLSRIRILENHLERSDVDLSSSTKGPSEAPPTQPTSTSDFQSTESVPRDFSSLALLLDVMPVEAPLLFAAARNGSFVHTDGSISAFSNSVLKCIFRTQVPRHLSPLYLGKVSVLHFDFPNSFSYLESAFRFQMNLFKSLVPTLVPTLVPSVRKLPPSLHSFFDALVRLFSMLFERILLIQKKMSQVPRLSAYNNFVLLLKQYFPAFICENPSLLGTPSSAVISRCVLGFFLQTINFSINVTPNQKSRKSFNRYLKSLLESFFNFNISAKYSLPFDRSLLKGMTSFDLDLFYFRDTFWEPLPLFFDRASSDSDYISSMDFSSEFMKANFSKKTFANLSSPNVNFQLNPSSFKLNTEIDSFNVFTQSGDMMSQSLWPQLPGHLRFLSSFIRFSKSATLRYHPRFPLKELLGYLLTCPSSTPTCLESAPSSPNSILNISPLENVSHSFVQNVILGSYIAVDPITLKHFGASNLSELSLTVLVSDVSLQSPPLLSFWNRLTSTGEIQNLGSAPYSLCKVHNTQFLCLSPILSSRTELSDHSIRPTHTPHVTIPDFSRRQLKHIFTVFVSSTPNVQGLLSPTNSFKKTSFVADFSETLSPFLTKLYFSTYLKDHFHVSVSEPRIFRILFTLCHNINLMRHNKENILPGTLIQVFKQVFRKLNIVQETAASILHNSSMVVSKSSSSISCGNPLQQSVLAKAVTHFSKDPAYAHFFKHISFGNYSREIIDQIAKLVQSPWVFSGYDSQMKMQHLLISSFNHSFRIANPMNPVQTCDQLKMILGSLLEELLRNWKNERVVILLSTNRSRLSADTQLIFHMALNNQFNLLFSRREVKAYCKKFYKKQYISRKSRVKASGEMVFSLMFDGLLARVVNFCIWDFSQDFEEKRRLFQCLPRVDMRSFSEFIETNFIKNKVFECSFLYSFLRETSLPLDQTTGSLTSHGLFHPLHGELQLLLEEQVRRVGPEHRAHADPQRRGESAAHRRAAQASAGLLGSHRSRQ